MSYEFVPIFLFGIVLLVTGIKLRISGMPPIVNIFLVALGLILIGWEGYVGWVEITNGL